ncbi:MAG: hypothetical protein EDM03_01685 [Porphyrobacter sp. IPPAS B-1204]|nr:MAG: hypothetical protein EDM03_01685 [Porphyrobacter sp. IPPAS B-1204]
MTHAKRGTLLLAAFTLALAAPALGQEPPAAPPAGDIAGEAVTIPFDPPIGTPVTYALRFERKRPSGDSVIDFEQQLTFDRIASGYVLRLETLAFASEGQRFDLADKRVLDAVPAALRVYLLPMTVELDAGGEMVRMLDWEAMRAALRQLPEAAAAMSGAPLDEAAIVAVRSVLDPIINVSAEDAPAQIIRGWPNVLGYGGAELVLGEAVEAETEVTGGILTAPIPAVVQGSLNRTPAGNLRLFQTTLYDPAEMRAATLATVERLKAQAARTGGAKPGDELQSISITDDVEVEFDPLTGLPLTARLARITSVVTTTESQVGGEITTIRRIQP